MRWVVEPETESVSFAGPLEERVLCWTIWLETGPGARDAYRLAWFGTEEECWQFLAGVPAGESAACLSS